MINSICKEAATVFAAQARSENPSGTTVGLPAYSDAPPGLTWKVLESEILRFISRASTARAQMTQHLRGGVLTDVEFLNGYLQNLGAHHGVATPSITLLYQMVKLRQNLLMRGKSNDVVFRSGLRRVRALQ